MFSVSHTLKDNNNNKKTHTLKDNNNNNKTHTYNCKINTCIAPLRVNLIIYSNKVAVFIFFLLLHVNGR